MNFKPKRSDWRDFPDVAIQAGIGLSRPIVAAVQAIEENGENVIPTALGGVIAKRLELELDNEIVQINRVGRTGSSGYYRLATQPRFAPGAALLHDRAFQG